MAMGYLPNKYSTLEQSTLSFFFSHPGEFKRGWSEFLDLPYDEKKMTTLIVSGPLRIPQGPLRIPALQLIGLPWLNKVVLSCLEYCSCN